MIIIYQIIILPESQHQHCFSMSESKDFIKLHMIKQREQCSLQPGLTCAPSDSVRVGYLTRCEQVGLKLDTDDEVVNINNDDNVDV